VAIKLRPFEPSLSSVLAIALNVASGFSAVGARALSLVKTATNNKHLSAARTGKRRVLAFPVFVVRKVMGI
jgi:hypothetical protein